MIALFHLHIYTKKINYFFIEAQKNKKSDIIMLKTKILKPGKLIIIF